jgi:hypothetical protein
MPENIREFQVGPDPEGRTWIVKFVWLQTAISIRHADAVDVKFLLSDGAFTDERVIALPHPLLREVSRQRGQPITDPWCMRLAAMHLKHMIETGEDMEKTLVTASRADLERADAAAASEPSAKAAR